MDIIAKSCAATIFGVLVCLLIKKHNPELSAAISVALTVLIIVSSLTLVNGFKDFVDYALSMLGSSSIVVRPILKCIAISFITKLGSDVCRDASISSAASALELTGILCAALVSMPMLVNMLKMIGEML